jgi:hypothetical protein
MAALGAAALKWKPRRVPVPEEIAEPGEELLAA